MIEVSCGTTHEAQKALVEAVYGPFGRVARGERRVRAGLDESFSFLFEKYTPEVPLWVDGSQEIRAACAGGYIDAEGSFGVHEGRARFKLDAYDRHVLHWLHDWCGSIGVRSQLRLIARRGDARPDEGTFNGDLWRVNVNEGPSILRLVATLEPYLRHDRRRAAALDARSNVLERLTQRVRP